MNVPKRMSVWASIDPIRKHWLTWLLLINILYGGLHLTTGGMTFWCGLLLLAATTLMGFGWSVAGAGIGMVVWSVFLFAAVASITPAVALPYGDLVLALSSMGWHGLVLYDVGTGLDADRETKQRA
jgi:hypothetical protein